MSRYPPLTAVRHVSFNNGESKLWEDCTEKEKQGVINNISKALSKFASKNIEIIKKEE